MKVVKFGGSSLANAEQFKKVASIVLADKTRRYVIPSAPGKRFNGDIKVTDLLYRMASEAQHGEDFSETLGSRAVSQRSSRGWSSRIFPWMNSLPGSKPG